MPFKIEHSSSVTTTTVATASASTTPVLPYRASAGGMLFVSALDSGTTTLTWYAASAPDVAPVPVIDGGNSVTTAIVAGRAYSIPDSLFAAPFIAAVTNSGTATFVLAVKG